MGFCTALGLAGAGALSQDQLFNRYPQPLVSQLVERAMAQQKALSFRVGHFNILGKKMAGTKWFHYARDFLPASFASNHWDWSRAGHFPRSLLWSREEGQSRFYRLEVLLKEIRSLSADVLCLVELDCFEEQLDGGKEKGGLEGGKRRSRIPGNHYCRGLGLPFQQILGADGYDAVFQPRPGKHDGCGIFWRREVFESVGPCRALIYALPANDRIAVAQLLVHRLSRDALLVLSSHLHWDQALGYQASEAQ
ncbi:unnamed protein product, partial [Durusdinium trenchii]